MAASEVTIFPLQKVQRLRRRAQRAAEVSPAGPEGWSKSAVDPMDLLSVFSSLKMKTGFVLRAYQFRSGSNGNGIIWAVPEDLEFSGPAECPTLEDGFLEPPRPLRSIDDFMEAIEGNGLPWSYLSASIFAREAGEFGAIWHGCSWGEHRILGKAPRSLSSPPDDEDARPDSVSSPGGWKWIEAKPTEWRPHVDQSSDAIRVTFYTFSGLGVEAIYCNLDEYKPGLYVPRSNNKPIAEGPRGYIF